ncbi:MULTISPECIES: hypothetical protein [unclassified Paenibacillus]|uniref:hypothetical protein n=1 Tax=unclassified Paenibacillus TaxID=185978 RepID=UPI000412C148|nr:MULTISPECIES: hypothetical protein [unclassified Paenibacillus]KGP81286.1 hypothetical protein P364_0117345 [Paenibacillus sp. MAEPY2]KGP87553.1 hypothetical protein P363_0110830 [Paenibacillus sp. MAEPY1]
MEALNREAWKGLSAQEKEELLRGLVSHFPVGMQYKGLETFERYDQGIETGVFSYDEQKFVFVPGDRVILGWNRWQDGMNDETSADLLETVSEYGVENVDSFLCSQMSPVREVHIAPMLVECSNHSLGWIEVTEAEAVAQENACLAEELEKFKLSDLNQYELHQEFRLVRQGEAVQIFSFNEDLTLDYLIKEEEKSGFGLLTEDEWEYLYGGGCRTLFPWGDSFDYTMKLKHFGSLEAVEGRVDEWAEPGRSLLEEDERPYDLELPNFFGIQFAGDPYTYELTVDASGTMIPKGGDGGAMICGGMGLLVGFLPAAAVYYRDGNAGELDWEEMIDYMNYRRVIRLADWAR